MMELQRWRDHLKIPINLTPKFFPANERPAALVVTAAKMQGHDIFDLCGNILQAVWIEEKNIADEAVWTDLINQAGLAGNALLEAAKDPQIEAAYIRNSEQAIEQGVFGAPTYILEGQIFWGQDRLSLLEAKLQK